ncbi:MAG: phosphatidate phosphatase App1 family protein [Maioricimonas sp. JB049]
MREIEPQRQEVSKDAASPALAGPVESLQVDVDVQQLARPVVRPAPAPSIRPDQKLLFFPSYGRRDAATGQWHLHVHGWLFQPVHSSMRRRALMRVLLKVFKLDRQSLESDRCRERLSMFLVGNSRGNRVPIRLGATVYLLPPSFTNGHLRETLRLPEEAVVDLAHQDALGRRSLRFEAVTDDADSRHFAGRIELVPERGVSVISDIDDTIKVSEVSRRRELLTNTFLRDFRSIEGMSEVYRRWARRGARFHYVSASPWQLFEPLKAFLGEHRFPPGSMHLRTIRTLRMRGRELLAARNGAKRRVLDHLLQEFPERQFILCGDSGQRDPEIYGELTRKYPAQVQRICIHNISRESLFGPRLGQAFRGLDRDRVILFDTADELPDTIP